MVLTCVAIGLWQAWGPVSEVTKAEEALKLLRAAAAENSGVDSSRITLDPGIGFSKRSEHSSAVLQEIGCLVETGYPVCVGVSRKRIVAEMIAREAGKGADPKSVPNEARDRVTVELNVAAYRAGATSFRVHDVAGNRSALDAEWRKLSA